MDNFFKEIISAVSGQKIEKLKKVLPEREDEMLEQLKSFKEARDKAQLELDELNKKADIERKNQNFTQLRALFVDIKEKRHERDMFQGSIDQLNAKLPSNKDEINSVVAEIAKKHNIQN